MWKQLSILLLALALAGTAACGAPAVSAPVETPAAETASADGAPAETPAAASAGTTFTGAVEENKGFMLTVSGDSGSYVFGTDKVDVSNIKVGDRVEIAYTGDLGEVGALLTATSVTVVAE